MMESQNEFIENLKPGMVFYFKDVEVSDYTPHYFVVLNKDIVNSPVLVLPVSTSQIDKRLAFYKRCNLDERCLVIVEPEDTNGILAKKSAFDCNQVKYKGIIDLYELYMRGKAGYEGMLPEIIIEKLRSGVTMSNQVEAWIKDLV